MKIPRKMKRLLSANGINKETLARKVLIPGREKLGYKGDLPTLLIGGAQKSGTTTLHQLLSMHPKIREGLVKESHFFESPDIFALGENYYRAIFPKLRPGETTLDSTPMMYHEAVPALVDQTLPKARMIMLLRDPVKRSFSHYLHNVGRKRETLSFEEALAAEEERITHTAKDLETETVPASRYRAFSYKERSRYDVQIERWRAMLGEENVKVILFEEFRDDLEGTVNDVLAWLGLDPMKLPESASEPRNTALVKAKIAPETETALREEFAPMVARVSALLNRDLPWEYPVAKVAE